MKKCKKKTKKHCRQILDPQNLFHNLRIYTYLSIGGGSGSVNKYFADLMCIVCEGVVYYAICIHYAVLSHTKPVLLMHSYKLYDIIDFIYKILLYTSIYLKFPFNPQ